MLAEVMRPTEKGLADPEPRLVGLPRQGRVRVHPGMHEVAKRILMEGGQSADPGKDVRRDFCRGANAIASQRAVPAIPPPNWRQGRIIDGTEEHAFMVAHQA